MFFVRSENPEPAAAAEILGGIAVLGRGRDRRRTEPTGTA